MAAVAYGSLMWTGYQRRRGTWTRRSWILFGGALLLTFALIGIALSMASGVDNGVYDGMSPRARATYFYTMLVLVLGGVLSTVFLILWFARGDPHRQFDLVDHHALGPGTIRQTELRDRIHQALVAAGFTIVAERDNPQSYGSWQRDYVRSGEHILLTWNSETWYFTLEGGKPLRELASKSPSDLSGSGVSDFTARVAAC